MKFVVDECTGPTVADRLRHEGHDVIFREQFPHHGVVLLRLRKPSAANHITALERLFMRNDRLIDQFIVVTDARIRVLNP